MYVFLIFFIFSGNQRNYSAPLTKCLKRNVKIPD